MRSPERIAKELYEIKRYKNHNNLKVIGWIEALNWVLCGSPRFPDPKICKHGRVEESCAECLFAPDSQKSDRKE
jgi:hypothetical protein